MLIATVSLPPEAIALEHTLADVPEVVIEAERVAAHATTWTMPCLWVANADFAAVDEALANDPTVEKVVGSDEFDDEKYYLLEWSETVLERINAFVDSEASLLEASADSEGWRITIRFVTRDQFEDFCEYVSDRGHSFHLQRLVEPGTPRKSYGTVTPSQRAALVTAVERGYYGVPRDQTARELADELGISHQSLSELLRRGTANLVSETLLTEGKGPRARN